ncbi:hypothetical protein [Methylobacterium terrae]|nr:hypothetical protein [Methylobacterium terrae]
MVEPDRRTVNHRCRAGEGIETTFLQDGTLALDPPGPELAIPPLFEEP